MKEWKTNDRVYITKKGERYLQKLKKKEQKVTERCSVVKKNFTTEKPDSIIKK